MTASSSAITIVGSTTSARTFREEQAAEPQLGSRKLSRSSSKQARVRARRASNVQSQPLRGVQETSPTLSHCVRALLQSHTAKMVTKKRDRSPSTTPMPTTEAAQNDGSHLTAAQWEGMQKVLNHIYDYRTEE
jgi:hypothetical protein